MEECQKRRDYNQRIVKEEHDLVLKQKKENVEREMRKIEYKKQTISKKIESDNMRSVGMRQ